MRSMHLALVGCFLAVLATSMSPATAQDKAKDLIVGRWRLLEQKDEVVIEFKKDGSLKFSAQSKDQKFEITGKYRVLDEDNLEVEKTFQGKTEKEKFKLAVTREELKLTDPKGTVDKFKRLP